MATTNTRYVDPDAAAGGNGTTNALSGGSCAYTSLSAWEAARQADLVSGDIIEECVVDSNGGSHTADTTQCTIAGWTTDATRYIDIHTPVSNRQAGVWDTTKYRLQVAVTTGNRRVLLIQNQYVRVTGVQVGVDTSATYASDIVENTYSPSGKNMLIDSCIIRHVTGGGTCYAGIQCGDYSTGTTIRNTIIYGLSSGGEGNINPRSGADDSSNYVTIENCTLYGGTRGVYVTGNSSCVIKNTIAMNQSTAAFSSVTWGTGTDYNASYDTTAPGTTTAKSKTSYSSYFTTPGSDFHLLGASSSVIGIGGNSLSGSFTKDIDGDTRSAWDIGADEYVSGGGGSQIKTWNTATQATVKTANGISNANIKTKNGVTNV